MNTTISPSLANPDPHAHIRRVSSPYTDLSHCNHECSPIRLQNKQNYNCIKTLYCVGFQCWIVPH